MFLFMPTSSQVCPHKTRAQVCYNKMKAREKMREVEKHI